MTTVTYVIMADKNDSNNGNIVESTTATVSSIDSELGTHQSIMTQTSPQGAGGIVNSGVTTGVSKTSQKNTMSSVSTAKQSAPVTVTAVTFIQTQTPVFSASTGGTSPIIRAQMQPVHLQPFIAQSYIAPHLVISNPNAMHTYSPSAVAVTTPIRGSITQANNTHGASGSNEVKSSLQSTNTTQRSVGARPVQGQVHPFVIGQLGTCVMQGTSVGGNRMAVGNNQTAHIIGTIPSVSQQFAATPVVNGGGTVIGQFSSMRPLQQGIAIQSPTLLNAQPLYIRTATPVAHGQHVIPVISNSIAVSMHSVESQTILSMKPPSKSQKVAPSVSPIKVTQPVQHVIQKATITGTSHFSATPLNKVAAVGTANAIKPITKLRPIKPASSVAQITQSATVTSLSQPKNIVTAQQSSEAQVNMMQTASSLPSLPVIADNSKSLPVVASDNSAKQTCMRTENSAGPSVTETNKSSVCQSTNTVASVVETDEVINNLKNTTDSLKQKAVVKPQPQILTHVIDGFIILEGSEPFPVQRSSLMTTLANAKAATNGDTATVDIQPSSRECSEQPEEEQQVIKETRMNKEDKRPLKCELCGKVDFAYRFKESKRFCSMACAKRYNVNSVRKMALLHPKMPVKSARRKVTIEQNANKDVPVADDMTEVSECSENADSVTETTVSVTPPELVAQPIINENEVSVDLIAPPELEANGSEEFGPEDMEQSVPFQRKPIKQWTVDDVLDFIKSLPGCEMYVDEFSRQEIDGQALILLKEDHMMRTMNIKLGPALKICAHITSLLQADS